MNDAPAKPAEAAGDRAQAQPFPLWLRALGRLPFGFWYAFSDFLTFLAEHLIRYRRKVIDAQLKRCFPEFDDAAIGRIRRDFYRSFADVLVESIKSTRITEEQMRARIEVRGYDVVRRHLAEGRSVLLATGHHCNWDWSLLALSLGLGYPLDAAYKPLHDAWADRLFLAIRSRFGAHMVPAKQLLLRVVRRRGQPRAIAMVADQDPVSAATRHFVTFFGQETAFYTGPEALARVLKIPVVFVATRRSGRGRYVIELEPLVGHDEELPEGGITERYARRVEALVRERPAEWLWSYRRWKMRRDADGVVQRGRTFGEE
ncbi:MAG: lysophospholipid acyltransferase family protein [Steroidobacteraceae bacterium]|jgi:KDO2-lipid IV(A) lauroyltransferase|nr:lysophospholipid acyltransferase family protein [Steroidobacteraceae bacterium]